MLARADVPADDGARVVCGVRDQVQDLRRRAHRMLEDVVDPVVGGGELGALADLAALADTVQAAMVTVTARVESEMLAQRRAGLPLTDLLALDTRLTYGQRTGLVRAAAGLERMPALAAAFRAGLVGFGEVQAVLADARRLDRDARAVLDASFDDHDRLARLDVDTILDEVAALVVRLDARSAEDDAVKAFERRFLAIQPGLDGTLAGYFELDDTCGAAVLRALDDAAAPVTGPRALSRDATLPTDEVDPDRRTLGRRRADALVALAGHWLAGSSASAERGGEHRPARPLVQVWTDISTLIGDDRSAVAARLLWDAVAPPPVLTTGAAQRLASDARLQFILADGGEVLGVTAPTTSIQAKVRVAVHARDQGCRFPGCRVPCRQTELHHVVARADGGSTVVPNLVALCSRHHRAVTDARWRLSMTDAGVVTVRRGRHLATSDPPVTRRLGPSRRSETMRQ